MKIREIFSKNIDRKINPAVVVTEQGKDIIKIEIEEYVFTADLIENLYKFLFDLLFRTNGKTGIWINGYYGSGKSHFIKYAHYCLESETSEDALNAISWSDYANYSLMNEYSIEKSWANLKDKIKLCLIRQF